MSTNPCKVCGGTELNLVDGYYYCVECGTQDANVRETIVEMTVLADGTIAISDKKKLSTKLKKGVRMSGEWYKWHAFNFIIFGLTEELISLGTAPTLKSKVLWIWTRYIKKFQNKQEIISSASKLEDETLQNKENSNLDIGDDNLNIDSNAKFTKQKLLAILYIALNLDHSDIQLSHLLRFINEGRLSIDNHKKFIPPEIKTRYIPKYTDFVVGDLHKTHHNIRKYAMNYLKCLDLGVPLVPNLTKIIDQYTKELCLPFDFRYLVLALIHLVPCDFLQIDEISMTYLVRVPNYEIICMSYVLLGLKICFGLDDDYEIRLSDAVDTINYNENHSKSYNLGFQSESSNRLFSFRDWYNYLHLRRVMLSKYYIHSAQMYGHASDDCILLEQIPKEISEPPTFSDHVCMDILNKIIQHNIPRVIVKEEFPPSLTPITTYLEIILPSIQDPDIKLTLCEDFAQYSLKYVTRDLKLPDSNFNINGVSENYKTFNNFVVGTLESTQWEIKKRIVYVRNCENHNWLKTNPPSVDHIKIKKPSSFGDVENEDEYNLNDESNILFGNADDLIQTPYSEEIEEESIGFNIFDDEFECTNNETKIDDANDTEHEINENGNLSEENNDFTLPVGEIDRNQIIQELIEIACKKHKIPLPKESAKDKPEKRKIFTVLENNFENLIKKRKNENASKEDVSRHPVNDIISAYYESLDNDILNRISEHVKNVVQEVTNQNTTQNESEENISNGLCVISETKSTSEDSISSGLCVINETKSLAEESVSNGLCVIHETKENNENESNINMDITQDNGGIDDSVLSDNDANEYLIPKINPDFDANTHITDQLYVKVEDIKDVKVFDVCDENLEKIIDKKIKEKKEKYKNFYELLKSKEDLTDVSDTSDSDDDVPLSLYKEEKQFEANKEKFTYPTYEPLLAERKVKKYKYWIRHYRSLKFEKNLNRGEIFDLEVKQNCPKSFAFILKECSSLIQCTAFSLYKSLQNLELRFMNYNNKV